MRVRLRVAPNAAAMASMDMSSSGMANQAVMCIRSVFSERVMRTVAMAVKQPCMGLVSIGVEGFVVRTVAMATHTLV